MFRNTMKAAARLQKRKRKVGKACPICGERSPYALRAFDEHHVDGRANNNELTATPCFNCHAKQTARQLDAEVRLYPSETFLERLMFGRISRACFFRSCAESDEREAEKIEDLLKILDQRIPGWRSQPEFK